MQRAIWNQNQIGLFESPYDGAEQFIEEFLTKGGIDALAAELMAIPAGVGF